MAEQKRLGVDVVDRHINAVDEGLDAIHLAAMKKLTGKSPEVAEKMMAVILQVMDEARAKIATVVDVEKCLTGLDEFVLPTRAKKALLDDDNYFLGQVLFRSPEYRVPNFGSISFTALEEVLKREFGFSIGEFEKMLPDEIKQLQLTSFGFSIEEYESTRQFKGSRPPETVADLFLYGAITSSGGNLETKAINERFFRNFFTFLKEQGII